MLAKNFLTAYRSNKLDLQACLNYYNLGKA
jgi:hypothetical protein